MDTALERVWRTGIVGRTWPASLTEEERQLLRDIVESGPAAYGFHTGIWTSINLAQVITEEFDGVYHQRHVRKLLPHIGLSVVWCKRTRRNNGNGRAIPCQI